MDLIFGPEDEKPKQVGQGQVRPSQPQIEPPSAQKQLQSGKYPLVVTKNQPSYPIEPTRALNNNQRYEPRITPSYTVPAPRVEVLPPEKGYERYASVSPDQESEEESVSISVDESEFHGSFGYHSRTRSVRIEIKRKKDR